jgi:MFS transporter, OPA family, glycerol-3-phosphate transporter
LSAPRAPLDPRLRVWRVRVFVATWLCYAGYYFCRRPFYVAKGQIADDLGFDASTLGTVGALYLVSYAAAQFLAGGLGNRFGPRVMLLGGMLVSIAANIGFGLSTSSTAFFALMTLNGAAQATGWSANIGTMAAWFNRQERGTVMGLWTTNFQAGGVVANGMAAWVLGAWDWRASLFSGAAVLFSVWLIVLVNQRDRPADVGLPPVRDEDEEPSAATSPQDGGGVATEPAGLGWTREVVVGVVLVGVYYFFLKLIRYALWSWAPFFLAKNYGLRGDEAGYVATLFDVCGIPGVILTGWLSDRFFKSRRAGVSLLMTVLLLASCLMLYTVGSLSVGAFAVGIAVAGFALYGPDALLTGAGAMDIGSRRGATLAAGIISGIGSLGPIVQELVIGKLYDQEGGDLGPIFLLLLGSALVATLIMTIAVVRNAKGLSKL